MDRCAGAGRRLRGGLRGVRARRMPETTHTRTRRGRDGAELRVVGRARRGRGRRRCAPQRGRRPLPGAARRKWGRRRRLHVCGERTRRRGGGRGCLPLTPTRPRTPSACGGARCARATCAGGGRAGGGRGCPCSRSCRWRRCCCGGGGGGEGRWSDGSGVEGQGCEQEQSPRLSLPQRGRAWSVWSLRKKARAQRRPLRQPIRRLLRRLPLWASRTKPVRAPPVRANFHPRPLPRSRPCINSRRGRRRKRGPFFPPLQGTPGIQMLPARVR